MPERWQRELRRLREVNVPPSVLERARNGPRREVPPPRPQRAVAIVVAFAVFIAGGAFAWNALRPRPSAGPAPRGDVEPRPIVVASFSETGPKYDLPYGTVAIGDATQRGQIGSFTWTGENGVRFVDAVTPRMDEFLMVPQGSELRIEGTATSVTGRLGTTEFPFEKIADLDLTGGTAIVDAEPGRYSLELDAHWPQGDVPFYFGIEIARANTPVTDEVPDVAQVVCATGGTTQVLTPVVRPQSDGVHFEIQNDAGMGALVGHVPERSGSNWAFEFERRAAVASSPSPMPLEPGPYLVQCMPSGDSDVVDAISEPGLEDTLEIRDVDRVWYPDSLSCDGAKEDGMFPGGDVSVNPASLIEQVLRRGVPGILPSDVLTPAGYPNEERKEWDWRVVRVGEVVALIRVTETGTTRYLSMEACRNSGVGDEDLPTAGVLATPFDLPGIARCDPYAEDCVAVYLSVARYAEARGEQPVDYGYDYRSENYPPYCPEKGPDGCMPDPRAVPWTLLMTPADAEAFIQANGCGARVDDLCR